jgi:hypothetical protein
LRLPGPVKEIFEERLRLSLPLRAERVLSRIRETRGGRMYDPRFGVRGKGEGAYATAIQALFEQTAKAVGLETRSVADDAITPTFARPRGQLPLF